MDLSRDQWTALGWETTIARSVVRVWKSTLDSRKVKKKTAFFAYDGHQTKGKKFIWQAIESGAGAVFLDKKHQREVHRHSLFHPELPIFFSENFLKDAAKTMYYLAGVSLDDVDYVGVTGTNGKTTVSMVIYELFTKLKTKSCYIGTLGAQMPGESVTTQNTSPDASVMADLFKKAKDKKVSMFSIEASSHGLEQGRLTGIPWRVAIFTNLSPEHLDYHKNMESYFKAKEVLFDQLIESTEKNKIAIIVVQCKFSKRLYNYLKKKRTDIKVIGIGEDLECEIHGLRANWAGYSFQLTLAGEEPIELNSSLFGSFNVTNLTCAFLTAYHLGYPVSQLKPLVEQLKSPPGRLEFIHLDDSAMAVIDYAHTPDALENAILTLRELKPRRIVTIFGCGGSRDKKKRIPMAKIAQKFSDFVIATSDNPRDEDPVDILKDVKRGLRGLNYVVIPERELAIRTGVQLLGPKEILLVAGKGHEAYQIIGDQKIYFSDKEQVNKAYKLVKASKKTGAVR